MKRFFHENGLSIVVFAIFFVLLVAQSVTGMADYNDNQREHGQPTVNYPTYLTTGHFIEAIGENWESEFVQMGAYVILTVFLKQKGSSESKSLDEQEAVDDDPEQERNNPDAPWPVRRGGFALRVYKHSLSIALFVLFLISFTLHAIGGAEVYNQEQLMHGEPTVSAIGYLGTAQFWFESFQNWQSEFLAVGSIVVLSIFLREQGSPESKPVASPHAKTGTS